MVNAQSALGKGGDAPPFSAWQRLDLAGLCSPIILPDAPQLVAGIRACLRDWAQHGAPVEPSIFDGARALDVVEAQGAGLYRVHSQYLDQPFSDLPLATTLCALLADVSQGWCETQGDVSFGLHCGGVVIGAGAVLLAGERRAGKSTLVARLSAEDGVTILCDDVLPIDREGRAIGLGIAPRLRLPLPVSATDAFRDHVARWLGPNDDRYGFLPAPSLAPHGTRVPATHFVLLDRRVDAPARLHRLDTGEVLHHVLKRAITGPETTEASFDAAHALAARVTGLRLVYSDLEDAVTLLQRAVADGAMSGVIEAALAPAEYSPPPGKTLPVDPDQVFRRSGAVAVRMVGGSAFLWQPGDDMLWDLNPVARAIWALLEEPATAAGLARDLAEIFPDVEIARLIDDIGALLGVLAGEGFIAPDTACRGDR